MFTMKRTLVLIVLTTWFSAHNAFNQPDIHIQLQEQLIVQNNDSVYVQRVMRLAKAAEMGNYMQPELDACDNFFQYSCGNWAKINPAEAMQPRETNYYQLLANAYRHKQLRLLEEAADPSSDNAPVLKLKRYYESCLHFRDTSTPLYRLHLQEIAAEFGHMPLLMLPGQEWPADEFNWLTTIARIKQKYGFDILLRLDVSPDLHNKTRNRVYVGQPQQLGLESKSLYSSEVAKYYRDAYARNIATQLEQHLGAESEQAARTAREILELEIDLARGLVDQRLSKPLSTLTAARTPAELAAAYAPAYNLTHYVDLVLGHVPNDTLYEYVPGYQANLLLVVKSTQPRVLANYIFVQLLQRFYYERTATVVEQCLANVRQLFPELLDHMVYKRYSDAATLYDIDQVWQQIKLSFKDTLESSTADWISIMTRKQALEKLNATRLAINGYAELNFTRRYEELHIAPLDYMTNLRAVLHHDNKQRLESLYANAVTLASPAQVSLSPAYIAAENLVRLPVALLQPNFLWSRFYPRALKYGTLGYLLAHELVHGFDDVGRNFDVHGNQTSWWDEQSSDEYQKRKACFKRQYGRFRYGGKYLAESELQSENIADNAAVQLAYSAYSNYLQQLSTGAMRTESLPNLRHTPQQLFFISFAQFWCNDVNEHFKDKVSLLDTHTPNVFRVIGSLSNFHAFARDFHCAADTTMNPSKRCQLYAINLE